MKKATKTPEKGPNTALFLSMGRMVIAAGVQYLRPKLAEWLDWELQHLLAEAGMDEPATPSKPARNARAMALAEASLSAHVEAPREKRKYTKRDDAGAAPAALDRASRSSVSQRAYWDGKTKEERIAIMLARMAKRKDPLAKSMLKGKSKPRGRAAASPEMIDGRYTKAGAATLLNVSIHTLDRRVKGLAAIRVSNGRPRATVTTYAAADIERLVAEYNGGVTP